MDKRKDAPSYVTESHRPASMSGGTSSFWPSVCCAPLEPAVGDEPSEGAGLRM